MAENTSNDFHTETFFEMYPTQSEAESKNFLSRAFQFVIYLNVKVCEAVNFHINKFTTLIPFAISYEKAHGITWNDE